MYNEKIIFKILINDYGNNNGSNLFTLKVN